MTKYILKTKLGQRLGIFYNEWATFCVLGRVFAPVSLVTLYFEFSNYDGVPTGTVPNSQVEIVNYDRISVSLFLRQALTDDGSKGAQSGLHSRWTAQHRSSGPGSTREAPYRHQLTTTHQEDELKAERC